MYEFEADIEDEQEEYTLPVLKRRATAGSTHTTHVIPVAKPVKYQYHIVTSLGFGICVVVAGLMLWYIVIVPWWHGVAVRWEYGTSQVSVFGADVGHGGTSRFIAFDNDNEIVIIEVIQKKYSVYTIPTGNQQNRLVTLSFKDVNGDGKLDIIVSVDGEEGSFVLINTGTSFRWNS